MQKKYTSQSDLSLNVFNSETNSNSHVSFTSITGGGSVFFTRDEKLQRDLEKHRFFNELFFLSEEEQELSAGIECSEDGDTATKIRVSCPDEAKDYLADKYGLTRTSLKSVGQIRGAAKRYNIEFEGLE